VTIKDTQDQNWLGDRNQESHEKPWPDAARGGQAEIGHLMLAVA
jgi:hypothetical protein